MLCGEPLRVLRMSTRSDLTRVPDGIYRSSSMGYEAQVHVEVAVRSGRIEDVRVTDHHEKQYYSSITDTCQKIIAKQGVTGIDATSSATMTSEAIINAAAKALAEAVKDKSPSSPEIGNLDRGPQVGRPWPHGTLFATWCWNLRRTWLSRRWTDSGLLIWAGI